MTGTMLWLVLSTLTPVFFSGHDRWTGFRESRAAIEPVTPEKIRKTTSFKNWGLYNLKARLGKIASHIFAVDAWKIERGSRSVVVAVVDTGVDPLHPDLTLNLWHAPTTKGADGKPAYGWDFADNKPNPIDIHGHGTHVAGIIGAVTNPKAGVSGVSPEVTLLPIRYYKDSNPGVVNLQNTVRAIHYAIDQGVRIINYSGGGPKYAHEEYLALKRAESHGILVVTAAGNNHENTDLAENSYYPGAYRLTNILSVAATNIKNELLGSSNWGRTTVDVAAPGEDIYSTIPDGKYGFLSGTSQATAFVSGLAALILAKNPRLTPPEVIALIRQGVDPLSSLSGKLISGGRINAFKTLVLMDRPKTKPVATDWMRLIASPPGKP